MQSGTQWCLVCCLHVGRGLLFARCSHCLQAGMRVRRMRFARRQHGPRHPVIQELKDMIILTSSSATDVEQEEAEVLAGATVVGAVGSQASSMPETA
jgi:hypothetical protein